ncbi:MAG: DUF397 domain-containing protein [Actinoallomurus sp.]
MTKDHFAEVAGHAILWRKSSRSQSNAEQQCVEVAFLDGAA